MNFLQKSPQEYMSISPQSKARGLEWLIWLKYDIILKGQNTFNLGLNTAINTHHAKKKLQIKVDQNWISHQKVHEHICLSPPPPGVEIGSWKYWHGWKMILYWNSKNIQFRAQRCQKYASHEKKLQIKVVQNWILYKKVPECICLSPPEVELEGSKD